MSKSMDKRLGFYWEAEARAHRATISRLRAEVAKARREGRIEGYLLLAQQGGFPIDRAEAEEAVADGWPEDKPEGETAFIHFTKLERANVDMDAIAPLRRLEGAEKKGNP